MLIIKVIKTFNPLLGIQQRFSEIFCVKKLVFYHSACIMSKNSDTFGYSNVFVESKIEKKYRGEPRIEAWLYREVRPQNSICYNRSMIVLTRMNFGTKNWMELNKKNGCDLLSLCLLPIESQL